MKIFNKNEWKKVKLGDICDLRNGVAIKSEDYVTSSNTLNCRMSNIRPDGTFDILYNAKYLPDNFLEKYKNYLLKDGDLVIAMTDMAGDPKILGVPTVVKSNGFNIIQNQRVGKLELLTKNIDENYLKLVLQSKKAKNYFKKFSAGGVQLNLSKKEILNVPIILPTIEEQKKLANLFKIIENFIYLRKEELVNLHFLNKSLFTTMFGDIKTNDKNWEIKKFHEIISILTDYHANGSYKVLKNNVELLDFKEYALMIRTTDLENDNFIQGVKYINEKAYNFLKKTKIFGGEIIINKIGSAGNVYLMPILNRPVSLGMNQFMIRLKEDYNNIFYYKLLKTDHYSNIIKNNVQGAVTKTITKDAIKNIDVIIPPIELQNKFAERIEKIEKLKFEIEKSIEETQKLYNSLISKYFDN